jgi:hypothetical protein
MINAEFRQPTYVFAGELDVADFKRYIALPFHVPRGMTRLHLDFQFEPWKVHGIKNNIAVSLFEPDGTFRGCRHGSGNHKVIDVGLGGAQEGFFPGPVPPGSWMAELDTFIIVPGSPIRYELRIWLSDEEEPETPACLAFPRPAVHQGAGWYRGDLHVHTRHSDGSLSVAEMVDAARQIGLDFIALTDHNNVTQLYHRDLDGCEDLAIIPGIELTTYYGHALSLGTTEWFDWRIGHNGRRMETAIEEIHAQGGLVIAAHLSNVGDPYCSGCKWLFGQFVPGALDAVEIWNGAWDKVNSNSEIGLQIWYAWLNAGHRIPATVGTDVHHGYASRDGQLGFSLIWAEELSAEALLDGLRQGHVMLSAGPRLWIEAPLPDGGTAMMGDAVPVSGPAPVTVRWTDVPSDVTVRLVVDGDVRAHWPASSDGERTVELLGLRWIVGELRSAEGKMLVLTNPIYLDRDLDL